MAYQFHISISGTSPLIWRRILVPVNSSFYDLHVDIQTAFGWENCHLFQFSKTGFLDENTIRLPDPEDEAGVQDARKTFLKAAFKKQGDALVYVYDFGDHWEHIVRLEELTDKEPEWAVCLDGENECPPEDVGSVTGYDAMLECFAIGSLLRKSELRDWLGLKPHENWEPGRFSAREANKRLGLIYSIRNQED